MSVDWHEQWALFAPNFIDGQAHIPLGKTTLLLHPGPGFGDLSHPTTELMLDLLKLQARGQSIVDIGTGSGILSLAALLLGSPLAIGLDIDPEALSHAHQNACLNNVQDRFSPTLSLPSHLPSSLFLMNMIFPEQKMVRPNQWNHFAKLWITSGILASQKKDYLAQTKEWGWTPLSEHRKGEWMAWVFQPKKSQTVS